MGRVIQGQELRDELLRRVRAKEDRGHRIGLAIDTDGQEHEVYVSRRRPAARPATARSAETEDSCFPLDCTWPVLIAVICITMWLWSRVGGV